MIALVTCGTHVLHAFQIQRTAPQLLAHVDRCEQAGDMVAADRYLARYVRMMPRDVDALARLALGKPSRASTPDAKLAAVFLLNRVLAHDRDRPDIRLILARLLIEIGRFNDAVAEINLLRLQKPEDAELVRLLGKSESGRGNYRDAVKAFREVIRVDSADVDTYASLAQLLRDRLEQFAEADALMDDLGDNLPNSAEACLARAAYFLKYHSRGRCHDEVERALRIDPEHVDTLRYAADLATDDREFAKARDYLDRALALVPDEVALHISLCKLHIAENQMETAIAVIRHAIDQIGKHTLLLSALADLLSLTGQWDEASQIIEQLGQTGSAQGLVEYLKAGIQRDRGNYLQASRMYERVISQLGDRPDLQAHAVNLLAECFRMMGQPDQAILQFRRVVRLRPNWPQPRWNLVRELTVTGRYEESLVEAELARLIGTSHAVDGALYLRLLIWKQRQRPQAEQSWSTCRQVERAGLRAWPGAPEMIIASSELLKAQDKTDEAIALLVDAVAAQPTQVELRVALVDLYDRSKRPGDAAATVRALEDDLGDSVTLRLTKSRRLRSAAEAEGELQALDSSENFSRADQIALVRGLGFAALRLKLFDLAKEYIAKLADLADYDLNSRLLLFDLALHNKDDAAMRRWVEQIRNIEGPKGVLWRFGESSRILYAAESNPNAAAVQDAWEMLEEARAQRPSWSKIYLNIARVEELQDRPDRALEAYQSALELGEHDPEVISRLVSLLASRGRYLDADRTVRRLDEDAPVPVELHRLAAEVFARSQDYTSAVEQARRYVNSRPKEYQSHVWLGQMLRVVGRAEEAEKALREGVRVAPTEVGAWVPLVVYLARTGRPSDALSEIEAAKANLPADQMDGGLAACYEAVGDLAQAEIHHKAALQVRPKDSAAWQTAADFYVRRLRWNEAESHLRHARSLNPESAAITRSLAVVLSAKGDHPSWKEALELVERNMKGGHVSNDDRRTKAMLLAMRGEARRQAEAIGLLEDLVNSASATAMDRHVLAQLYYARCEAPKGREQMLFLLAQHPENRVFVTTYLKSLLDRGDAREAANWMRRLDELDPESTTTLSLKTRLLALQGAPTEAAELLQKKVDEAVASGEGVSVLLDVAKLYERLGDANAAGDVYRRFRSMKSEGLLPLSSWLAQHGKIDEAVSVCEEAWEYLSAEEVAIPSALIVRTGQASESQQKLIESRVVTALRKNPDSIPLRLALAWLCDSETRYTEAIAIYRDVLRSDPKNIFALNSLAWLISQCQGSPEEALKLIERAVEQHGPVSELLDTRGMIRAKLGRLPSAIEDLQEASASSTEQHIQFHLAQAYQQAGQTELSRKKFSSLRDHETLSRELHWSERPALQQLAKELRKTATKRSGEK